MAYSSENPNTVAIAHNLETINGLVHQLDVAQTELDVLAGAGVHTQAFQKQRKLRDYLEISIQTRVRVTSRLLDEEAGRDAVSPDAIAAAKQSLIRIEKRVALYRSKANAAQRDVSRVQGELEETKYRMNSEYLQFILMFGGMILIVVLSARPLVTTGPTSQELVIVVGAGVLALYSVAQYIL